MLYFLMFGASGVLFWVFFLVMSVREGNGWFAEIFFFILVVCTFHPIDFCSGVGCPREEHSIHISCSTVHCTLAPKPHPTSYIY